MTAEELIRTALALKGEMPETADDYRGYAPVSYTHLGR